MKQTSKFDYKKAIAITTLLLSSFIAGAHSSGYDFVSMNKVDVGLLYFELGFTHIIPLGLDHILFVLAIFLLQPKFKALLWQATTFTVAHSITLALAIYEIIVPLPQIIEPIIALSIVFIAIENILFTQIKWWRYVMIFLFGLIHGCGFAGVLHEIGLPDNDYILALINFNLGVEAGQIAVIILCWFIIGKWTAHKQWYHKKVAIPLSIGIAAVAFYWTVERLMST